MISKNSLKLICSRFCPSKARYQPARSPRTRRFCSTLLHYGFFHLGTAICLHSAVQMAISAPSPCSRSQHFSFSQARHLSTSSIAHRPYATSLILSMASYSLKSWLTTCFAQLFRFKKISRESLTLYVRHLVAFCRVSISIKVELHASTESGIRASAMLSNDCAILPFKNSGFERHLDPIHLNAVGDSRALTSSQTQIFRELSYWRSQEKVLANKGSSVQVERQADKKALTQNQNFRKEIQVYAASLTNASGKVLEPQIIVAGSANHHRELGVLKPAKQQEYANESPKRNKQPGNPNKKGGKIAALEAAAEIKAITMKPKSEIKTDFWRAKCKEILAEDDLTIRRKLGLQYLQSLDKCDHLGPEVQLFTVDCLFQVLIKGKTSIDKMSIAALAWDTLHRLSKATVGVTPEVAMALKGIIISLGFPGTEIKTNAPSRPLAFPCVDPRTLKRDQFSLPGSPIKFQLEHCGPYLDRAIDSASDSHVPFEPDG